MIEEFEESKTETVEIPKAEYERLSKKAQIYDLLIVRTQADDRIAKLEQELNSK